MDTPIITPNRIALEAILPSNTNPRRRFDEAALEELAGSVKRLDVLQPILLRPSPVADHYELVAGERRWRAAKIAGLPDIPATIRQLSDEEVLEIQVIENVQRDDLLPMEEAEGYDRLMKCVRGDGSRYTAEEIAQKIGKSKGYVYAKLKLVDLCPEARKALEEGTLGETTAVMVARIPVHDLQRQAVKEIVNGRYHGAPPMTHREAAEHLQRNYMLRLADAPFDRKAIYTIVTVKGQKPFEAPLCGACPKRTGNQPDLFPDVKSADVCTDPKCFHAKREAAAAQAVEEARAQGATVIEGTEAKSLFAYGDQLKGGYVKPSDMCHQHPQGATWEKVLGKQAPELLLIQAPSGELVKAWKEKDAVKALKEKAPKWLERQKSHKQQKTQERTKEQEEEELGREARYRAYLQLRQSVIEKGLAPDELRAMIRSLVNFAEPPDDRLVVLWGVGEDQIQSGYDTSAIEAAVDNAPNAALLGMLLDACLQPSFFEIPNEAWPALAEKRAIDLKAIARDVKIEMRDTTKKPKKAATTEAVEA